MDSYQAVFKRKEIKYLLTSAQLEAFRTAMEEHMEPDAFPHSSISNLYYDTPDFRMVRRSLEKPLYKEKLRLRSYATAEDSSQAFLEIKKKALGVVYKRRESLPYSQAVAYLDGSIPGGEGQIFRELDWILFAYGDLSPAMFVSYERDSFRGLEDPGLRLTLDRDILWRIRGLDLRLGAWGEPLLKEDETLMEVKISNAMPLWLSSALSDIGIFPLSYSKYGRAYQQMEKEMIREDRRYA